MTHHFPLRTDIVIEPKKARDSLDLNIFPLKEMQVGQSFLVPPEYCEPGKRAKFTVTRLSRKLHLASYRIGIKLELRKRVKPPDDENGLRVLRIA